MEMKAVLAQNLSMLRKEKKISQALLMRQDN